jgi:hypothetical protein
VGAPTAGHEQRAAELDTLAVLAGYTAPLTMPWRLRPDVLRACPATGGLFVGDAKETEAEGCEATFARLRWYVVAASGLLLSDGHVILALAIPRRRAGPRFERLLAHALAARFGNTRPTTTLVGDTAVVAVRVAML